MSIDTAAKRARAVNTAVPHVYATGPVPDGSADRPFVLHAYFEASGAAATPGRRRVAAARKRRRSC